MKSSKVIFRLSLIMLLISSSVVFLIPFIDTKVRILSICTGAIFWGFLIIGIVLFMRLPVNKGTDMSSKTTTTLLLKLLQNKTALIFDVTFILSVIINIVIAFAHTPLFTQVILMFLSIFSFEMIFVFHSKRYKNILKAK